MMDAEELEGNSAGLKSVSESQYVPQFTLVVSKSVKMLPRASIIIPVYNEVNIIFRNLLYLSSFLGEDYEVIVCDDNSDDGTCDVLDAAARRKSNIHLLRFRKRIGKGGTIKKAIEIAESDVIAFMDADLSANLQHLPEMLRLASEKDTLVISRRTMKDRLTQGILRVMLSLGYNLAVRLFFRTGVRDHQCGFKAMNKDVAKCLMSQTRNDRFVFDTELVVLAKRLGIPIDEVQIEWVDRRPRCSNIKWIRAIPEMLKDVVILNGDCRKMTRR